MIIKYLKEVEKNPVLRDFKNEKMTITDIKNKELLYNSGNEFPKAFREFLFLAGEFNNFSFDLIENLDYLQELAKQEIESVGMSVDRPFIAFDVYNSQYSVIFLDENKENPDVYLISPFLAKGGMVEFIKPNGWNFRDLVNESIRRVKNNIAP